LRDPTIPDIKDRKKIMFYDSADRQTRLKIRCDYDGISQSQFFRMMITGYIENDNMVYTFLKKYKEKYKIQGDQKRSTIEKIRTDACSTQKKHALAGEEIENIFDIIETETGL